MFVSKTLIYFNLVYDLIGNSIYYSGFANGKSEYSDVTDFMDKSFWSEIYIRATVIYGLMCLIFIPLGMKNDLVGLQNVIFVGSTAIFFIILVSFFTSLF